MAASSGIHVNFTDQEASSEARDFDPLPTGKYNVYITDIELKESTSEKNFGKPYWAMEFTVADGPYVDRKLWTNCMLFDGALYTLSQLLKATGHEDAIKTGKIPDAETFIGQQVVVSAKKEINKYAMNKERESGIENPEVQYRTEVKGIKPFGSSTAPSATASTGKKNSLLP
jgi:hypothetical protein